MHPTAGAGGDDCEGTNTFKGADLARNVDGMKGEVSSSAMWETSADGRCVCPISFLCLIYRLSAAERVSQQK